MLTRWFPGVHGGEGATSLRGSWIALLLALALVAGVGRVAEAASLSVSTDKSCYEVGETVTITVVGDPSGGDPAVVVYGQLEFDGSLAHGVASMQTTLLAPGGYPWTVGLLGFGPGMASAFNQLAGDGSTPILAINTLTSTIELVADAPGVVDLQWGTSVPSELDFFGLTSASGTSFTIASGTCAGPGIPLGTVGSTTLDSISTDSFGRVLASGDFDGDGFDDLAVGDPLDDTTQANQGAIHIFQGTADGVSTSADVTLRQGVGGVAGTAEVGDEFGAALAVGNFNNDAFDDLAVGVPGESVNGQGGAGEVFVFFGSASGLRTDNEQVWSQDSSGISGASLAGDSFGAALAVADFDADTYDDLVIGVPGKSASANEAGLVMLLPGSAGGPTSVEDVWEQGFNGLCCLPDAGDHLGASLVAGDFDGDGYADLVIGAPGEAISGTTGAGSIHILEGSSTGLPQTCQPPTSNCSAAADQWWHQSDGAGGVLGSAETASNWGRALAACDFDGDGRDDLALGMLTSSYAGIVQIHPGSPSGLVKNGDAPGAPPFVTQWEQGFNLPGTATVFDRFGDALACGNFNDDPYDDLAIAVPYEDELGSGTVSNGGQAMVLYGATSGLDAATVQTWDRGDPAIGDPPQIDDRWATAFGVGDFDANGHDDLAIGMDPASVLPGAVDVLYGKMVDSDLDRLLDGDEIAVTLTDPQDADGDDDGASDGAEIAGGSDPDDPASTPFFAATIPLDSGATIDSSDDPKMVPRLATDRAGNWVAVWEEDGAVVATATADVSAWTSSGWAIASSPLVAYYSTPAVAVDALGNCVVVHAAIEGLGLATVTSQINAVRLTNGCSILSSAANLTEQTATFPDPPPDTDPAVATDGSGTFVAVWASYTGGSGYEIWSSRSTDGGVNWSMKSNISTSGSLDFQPEIATDGDGHWIALWSTSVAGDRDIYYAASADNGASWTPAAPLNTTAASDAVDDTVPHVVAGGDGRWMAVWQVMSGDVDVFGATTTDDGLSWSAPFAVNTDAATDVEDDLVPRIATDGLNYAVVWVTDKPVQPLIGSDDDVVMAISSDLGATWSAPVAVNLGAPGRYGEDVSPDLVTDGLGQWVAAWTSTDPLWHTVGSDRDLLAAAATGPDSDGDGIPDGEELHVTDTDGDGLFDGQEDVNQNGVVDAGETDATDPDSDGDGFSDGEEVAAGTDPLDALDSPFVPSPVLTLPAAGLVILSWLVVGFAASRLPRTV
jgi:hypothetical protein